MEKILITGHDRDRIHEFQRELTDCGYLLCGAMGNRECQKILKDQQVDLVVVLGDEKQNRMGKRFFPMDQSSPSGDWGEMSPSERMIYDLCSHMKSSLKGSGIPILLVGPIWAEEILARGLKAGADYILFSPYHEMELLHCIWFALLNGGEPEQAVEKTEESLIHGDWMFTHLTSNGQLLRLLFSTFDQLQYVQSAVSWREEELKGLRLQQERISQQTLQTQLLPDVICGIAHDFSNVLQEVVAASTMLSEQTEEPVVCRSAMDSAISQAGALINALQNLTDPDFEEWRTGSIELSTVVDQAVHSALLSYRGPEIRLRVQVQNLPPVQLPRALIFLCLNNLISNSIQAMPTGGMLSILGYVQAGKVVPEVSDTGEGIPEEIQDEIFRPHFSTRPGHSGMGLSLVQRLIQQCAGDVRFASREGKGATFVMSLPEAVGGRKPSVGSKGFGEQMASQERSPG